MNGVEVFIPLTRGYVTVLDIEDLPKIWGFSWHAKRFKGGKLYAARSPYMPEKHIPGAQGDAKMTVLMHRELLGFPKGDVDHRDGDTLNNKRDNLRVSTRSQNCANQKIRRTNTSGFKGVSWKQWRDGRNSGAWAARISVNYKRLHLGYFSTAEEAARAYDAAAQHHFGEFAKLNFAATH